MCHAMINLLSMGVIDVGHVYPRVAVALARAQNVGEPTCY